LNPTANISSPGIYKYYLNVIDINNCLSLDSVTITVKDVPNLTFNTQMLDFGVLESCSNSKTDSIVITNSGTDNIVVDSIHFDSGFGKFSPALPISLSPGEYATVLIVFTPTSTGLAQGTLQFITKSCETIFSIQAKGTQNELLIKQDIAGMDFGQSLSCESIDKTDTLTLSNTGTANILLDFTQTGIIAPYTLVEPSGTATLSPSTDIKVVVRYKPTTAGNFNQVARIPYTAGACLDTINFSLTANNIEVNTTASYQNVDFPPLTECQTTKDTVISIQNTGNVLLQVIAVEQAPVFITTDSLPISIQPGETKQLNLTFSPTAQGNFNGRVVLQYSLCANTDTIALSGIKQGVVFVTTDTLNLGELVICRDSAISVTDSIVNATNVGTGGTITSVSIDPHFETTLKRGTLLPPGISTKFDVSYELDASAPLGPVLGKMTIIISPCNIEKTIYLKAVKGDVKFEKVADLDFGKRETGSDSVATISFINNGTATSLINSINGVFPPFSISSIVPAVPDSLAPGDSIVIFVKYSPINIKKDTATITIGCNEPCVYHADAMITGEGIKPVEILPVELTVSIPNIKDSINRDISIPIIITSKDQLLKSKAKSFYAEISFNKTILLPFDSTDLGTINGGLRKLTLVGGISDTLYVMNFKTALGDAESTVISIDSIAFPGVKTIITKQNGTFSLMDICREGGSRLVNTDNILKLFDATPNPAGDRITFEFELIEEAPARLLISNIIGEQVVTVFETSKPGQYKIDYSTSLLDNGIYYYVLQTPSGRIGKLMGVVK
jgi:hypothetical protein